MKKITELTAELAAPAIAEQGCTLWDVEYVKEAGTWYLRILLDKEGGVDILDCEEISRKVRIWSSPRRRLPLSACGWNFNQSPSRQDVFYQQGESAT